MSTPTQKIPFICGIDETGRGPVLGPMLYTIAYCRADTPIPELYKKINDSKKLTKRQRETIFALMRAREGTDHSTDDDDTQEEPEIKFETIVTSSKDITNQMLKRQKYNLNLISHDCALNLVDKVQRILEERNDGSYIAELYVDTVGPPATYHAKFEERFPLIPKVVVESKADANYPIVSAASIVAKVTRDEMVEHIEKHLGELGSGYPSDPKTKKYLADHFDELFAFDPRYVRLSWGTVKDLINNRGIDVEWSDEDEESVGGEGEGRKRKRSNTQTTAKRKRAKKGALFSFAITAHKNQRCRMLRTLHYSTSDDFCC